MTTSRPNATRGRTPVQFAALIYGIVFLVVGIAGFIPGVTTDLDSMQFGGHHSEAMLLGVFQVSVLHNVVHLLYGLIGVAMSRYAMGARHFLLWGGIIYLVFWGYGLVVEYESAANFVPLNDANNWLHLVLGLTMVGLALLPSSTRDSRDTFTGTPPLGSG